MSSRAPASSHSGGSLHESSPHHTNQSPATKTFSQSDLSTSQQEEEDHVNNNLSRQSEQNGAGTSTEEGFCGHGTMENREDDEDEFVYMLENVKSTSQAFELMRRIQSPRGHRGMNSYPYAHSSSHLDSSVEKKQVGELPKTIDEFQQAPTYTVSLTTTRNAIFEDALSGFRFHVEQEDKKINDYKLRQTMRNQGLATRYERDFSVRNGMPCVRAIPVVSSENSHTYTHQVEEQTQSWVTLDPPAALEVPHRHTIHAGNSIPESAFSSLGEFLTPQSPLKKNEKCCKYRTYSSVDDPIVQKLHGKEKAAAHRPFQARTPLSNTKSQASSFLSQAQQELPNSLTDNLSTRTKEEITFFSGRAEEVPGLSVVKEEKVPSNPHPSNGNKTDETGDKNAQNFSHRVGHKFACVQVPELFRLRYPSKLWAIAGDHVHRPVPRSALEASRSHPMHQFNSIRYRPAHTGEARGRDSSSGEARGRSCNRVRPEWIHVWEQFKRDIHREVLIIDGISYCDPDEAIEAILRYLENCYDHGRAVYLEHKAESEKTEEPAHEKNRSQSGWAFMNFLLRESAAAIKDTVQIAQKTISDVLSAAHLNHQALHSSVVYSHDPVLRAIKIFDAAREVVLASQQSFVGFPYQLLYEQLGTERLSEALDELMRADDDVADASASQTDLPGPLRSRCSAKDLDELDNTTQSSSNLNSMSGRSPYKDDAHLIDIEQPEKMSHTPHRELRRRHFRQERMKRLPLLVGEPHVGEFEAFLDQIRSRVVSMNAKDTSSGGGNIAAGLVPPHMDLKENECYKGGPLFREDVEGSVYLIPVKCDAEVQSSITMDNCSRNKSKVCRHQGVRIHLYFHKLRNLPVICVSKVFRLFTLPDLDMLATSSKMSPVTVNLKERELNHAVPIFSEEARPKMFNSCTRDSDSKPPPALPTENEQKKDDERSLLVLMQVRFTLFTDDEAEVRWKWYHV